MNVSKGPALALGALLLGGCGAMGAHHDAGGPGMMATAPAPRPG